MAIFAVESSTFSISSGANRIATTAPATAVTRVNSAVIRPCRNPEIGGRDQQHDDDRVDDVHYAPAAAPTAGRTPRWPCVIPGHPRSARSK